MEPFSKAYHFNFCHAHREWYESFDRYRPGDELLRVARATLPPAWRTQRDGIWFHAKPPEVQLPAQGWKIHVSATPLNCEAVLRRTVAVCVEKELAFKFNADRKLVSVTTGKGWGREASGKFITIYPLNEEHFKEVIEALYEVLRDFDGPYVLSDKRYKDSNVLYYRYGGIVGFTQPTVTGIRQYLLKSPSGQLVPDSRVPYFDPPDWVSDPFPSAEPEEESEGLKDGRFRIDRALSFSVTGGVYAGTDLDTGSTVLIKEARPHTGIDQNGLAATDRLQKEYRLLQKLDGLGVTPAPVDLFWEWEHLFLVEEYIPGVDLAQFTISSSPFMKGLGTQRERAAYVELLRKVWTNLTAAIEAMHGRDVVFGDLSMRNVMLTERETGDLRIIDLESAWQIGVDRPAPWFGSPGYTPPGGVRSKADDLYSLGAVMLGTMFPINSFLDQERSATNRFIEAAGADLGVPEPLRGLIQACMDDQAESRPSTVAIRRVLADPTVTAAPPPTDVTAAHRIPKGELLATVERSLDYIRTAADFDRQDRLFPADPFVFVSNPLNLAFGAVGVAYALQRIAGAVPTQVRSWILSQPVQPDRYPPGLYMGTAGVAWGMWEMGLQDVALNVLLSTENHPLLRDAADVFYGSAGYGLTCLRFYLNTRDQVWLDKAMAVGDQLVASAVRRQGSLCWPDKQGNVWLGYGRGSSGVALFLLYLSLATGENCFLTAGQAALDHDLDVARPIPDGPLSMPRGPVGSENSKVLSHYWWDGSAGVVTALTRYWAATREPRYKDVLSRMAPDSFRKYTSFPGLVRGLSGLGNCLLDAYDFTGEERYLNEAHRVATGIRLFAIDKPGGIAFPGEQQVRIVTDYGSGSAGVALYLHRLANAGEQPGDFNFTLDELLRDRRRS